MKAIFYNIKNIVAIKPLKNESSCTIVPVQCTRNYINVLNSYDEIKNLIALAQ